MARYIFATGEGGVDAFLEYDAVTLVVSGGGVTNPRGRRVTMSVLRTSDGRVEGTVDSTGSLAVSIPAGRRQALQASIDPDTLATVLSLPAAWTLQFGWI
jgi:hypothetical protein